MKLQIKREPFVENLNRLVPLTTGKQVLPILSSVYLRCQNKDFEDHLMLDACDLKTYLKIVSTDCQVEEAGGICLDGKKLYEIAKNMTGADLVMEKVNTQRIKISSGASSFNLNGLDGADFPSWPADDSSATLSVPRESLALAIDRTIYACAKDESRFNLNSVLFEVIDKSIRLIATDGHRMAFADNVADVELDSAKLLIPRKSLVAIRKFIDKTQTPIDIEICSKHIRISAENASLGCRLLDGDYPDYNKVIPNSTGTVIAVNREALKKSLEMIRLMTTDRNKGINISIKGKELTTSAINPDLGSAQDTIEIEYGGADIDLIVNVEYVLENLTAVDDEYIQIEYHKDGAPLVMRPVDDMGYFNIVMPMRK